MMQLKKQIILFLCLCSFAVNAQNTYKRWPDIIRKSDAAWFATADAKRIAENVLLYQRDIGGWPKNIQMQDELTEKQKKDVMALKKRP
ncbi:hypothetical protein BB050_03236 [Flavobacterium anhuiense]|uniref:Pectate lyase n=1 Tax=Flavobacterium anhuiense TaxID=459526 RepID=A0AAC9GJ72_9FLAO|nr:pectate lyase [Flavobacterium anhuiense]AOC96325.1 hypothetical protein BB050_03236 [Flavobacterium anhuiense]